MESVMGILAAGGLLLFLTFTGIAVALLVAASLAGLVGGIACLLEGAAAVIRPGGAPRPKPMA